MKDTLSDNEIALLKCLNDSSAPLILDTNSLKHLQALGLVHRDLKSSGGCYLTPLGKSWLIYAQLQEHERER